LYYLISSIPKLNKPMLDFFTKPTIFRMANAGLIADYTDTTPLTNRQRVSISINATGPNKFLVNKRIYFQTGQNLNAETIKGISIDCSTYDISRDPTNGKLVPTYDELANGYLVMVATDGNKEFFQIPLTDFVNDANGGKVFMCNLDNVNIGASYVRFFTGSTLDDTFSLPFTFMY